jgi:hypothetical protein
MYVVDKFIVLRESADNAGCERVYVIDSVELWLQSVNRFEGERVYNVDRIALPKQSVDDFGCEWADIIDNAGVQCQPVNKFER